MQYTNYLWLIKMVVSDVQMFVFQTAYGQDKFEDL